MIKKYFILILFSSIFSTSALAENNFIPYRINFIFENDVFNSTDEDYSSGESLSAIFYIDTPTNKIFNILKPLDNNDADIYINISITNQIYTPSDINATQLLVDDHPYAGWTFVKMGLLQSSALHLNALSIKMGMVGPSSASDKLQYNIHKAIDSTIPNGWEHQLKDELGINLQYLYKRHLSLDLSPSIQRTITPFVEAQLGNISTSLNGGFIVRMGRNIPKDFGFSNINIANEDGVPTYGERQKIKKEPWSFNFNVTLSASAIARDIFLDGNTFKNSPSVEKENFVGHFGYGFSLRYKNFAFEFLGVISTKKFKTADGNHAVGTTKFAWIF